MGTLEPIIAEHPFFSDMDDRYIQLLVGCASNVRFNAGHLIFREGEDANQFYVLRKGRVALQMATNKRGSLTVMTLQEGDVVGWSWLFPPYKWKFSARALEDTRALALDGKCLRDKSDRDHDLGYELLKRFVRVVEDRLQATRLQLLNVYDV
jgi:CRP/FNR family cyclic AMP-dependent transcriptional regulator